MSETEGTSVTVTADTADAYQRLRELNEKLADLRDRALTPAEARAKEQATREARWASGERTMYYDDDPEWTP